MKILLSKTIHLYCLVAFLLLIFSCSKRITETNYYHQNPPNGIKVAENFYCDQTEATNFFWMEYMYWTKRVFGPDSKEYRSTFPDTNWSKTENCLLVHDYYYLRHPAYRDFPLIGISQHQAIDYSKWRSDRVFEYALVKMKKLKFDTLQTPETYFTIEKYFNDEMKTVLPGKKVYYYPEFSLPTLVERNKILHFSDSLDRTVNNTKKAKRNHFCSDLPNIHCNVASCSIDTIPIEPTVNVSAGCNSKKTQIYHLRGNVNEWTSVPNITVGGSWTDSREKILLNDVFQFQSPNIYTGFRNVCVWKEWDGLR